MRYFHLAFTWEKYPNWVRYFSSQLVCMPVLSSYDTFVVYLFFCFYFNFESLINIHTAKFYKMNCTFSRNNDKSMFTWRKIIPQSETSPALRWDLTWVEWIHSHINDLFLQMKNTILPTYRSGEVSQLGEIIFLI